MNDSWSAPDDAVVRDLVATGTPSLLRQLLAWIEWTDSPAYARMQRLLRAALREMAAKGLAVMRWGRR